MYLSDYSDYRDNNLNLIRMTAATAVLVSHSFVIVSGSRDIEPLRDTLGVTLGTIAVDVFFILSGFLVTKSLASRQNGIDFIVARVLRVFPGLITMLLFTAFVMGPLFTTLPVADYIKNPDVWKYLVHCAILVKGLYGDLPGVFDANPFPRNVNGSLWTLPWEVKLYALLLVLYTAAWPFKRYRQILFKAFVLMASIVSAGFHIFAHYQKSDSPTPELFFMLFSGAAAYFLRARIFISK